MDRGGHHPSRPHHSPLCVRAGGPGGRAFPGSGPPASAWLAHGWLQLAPLRWEESPASSPNLSCLAVFFDHNVSAQLAQQAEFNLQRPAAYHWDFMLLGALRCWPACQPALLLVLLLVLQLDGTKPRCSPPPRPCPCAPKAS